MNEKWRTKLKRPHVILVGNPRDGYHVIGPFETGFDANEFEFKSTTTDSDCYDSLMMPLEAPESVKKAEPV